MHNPKSRVREILSAPHYESQNEPCSSFWNWKIRQVMDPSFKMQLFYAALVINSFSDSVLIKRRP